MRKNYNDTPLLTAEVARVVFCYCPETGLLTRAADRPDGAPGPRYKKGDPVGTETRDGYLKLRVLGRYYRVHRLIWLMVTGHWPVHGIDHRDGNPANNRIANLRDVPQLLNARNQRRPHRDKITDLPIGVYRHNSKKNPFVARMQSDGSQVLYLGCFPTVELAVAARQAVAVSRGSMA